MHFPLHVIGLMIKDLADLEHNGLSHVTRITRCSKRRRNDTGVSRNHVWRRQTENTDSLIWFLLQFYLFSYQWFFLVYWKKLLFNFVLVSFLNSSTRSVRINQRTDSGCDKSVVIPVIPHFPLSHDVGKCIHVVIVKDTKQPLVPVAQALKPKACRDILAWVQIYTVVLLQLAHTVYFRKSLLQCLAIKKSTDLSIDSYPYNSEMFVD